MLKQDVLLYHGSYTEVLLPDLAKCREGKDFGKGFYLTSDKSQAKRFVRHSIMKARQQGIVPDKRNFGFISTFRYVDEKKLRLHFFEEADADWLHCIVAHRKNRSIPGEKKKWAKYDVIGGKIANDFTNTVITTYLDGGYGEIASALADQTAINLLEPDKLKDQFCFRTENAISSLTFVKSERIDT